MEQARFVVDRGVVNVAFTSRADGSLALTEDRAVLERRRAAIVDLPWLALQQVHGADVVDGDGAAPARSPAADAVVLTTTGRAVSVLTADCAPVVLVGSTGVALAHAGWRGAAEGVIQAAADALRSRGSAPIASVIGPCIQPASYAFGVDDLSPIVDEFGSEVISRTVDGRCALDLPRVVQIACERAGWPTPDRPVCTSSPAYFSHRTRGDLGRQAAVAWLEPADDTDGGDGE